MEDKKIIVRVIRTLVDATGLNPFYLGIKIGASEKSIYKWQNGSSMPSCVHLLRLMKIIMPDHEVLKNIRLFYTDD